MAEAFKMSVVDFGRDTPEFSLDGIQTYGRVVDIYDGDTMKVVISLFGNFYKFNVRLAGIDTCEIKSKNEQAKLLALRAHDKLVRLCLRDVYTANQTKKGLADTLNSDVYSVWLQCYKFDKFGRLLCDVYDNQSSLQSFSSIMLDERLAYPYHGDTKLSEEEQIRILAIGNPTPYMTDI
jgi:endonuclease YncB( thermonuclease family)